MTTVPTWSGATPARAMAARIATAPSAVAVTSCKLPPNFPIAVRTGSARTTVRDAGMTLSPRLEPDYRRRLATHRVPSFGSKNRAKIRTEAEPSPSRLWDCNIRRRYAYSRDDRPEARAVQLLGATPGGAPCHTILRPVSCRNRSPHHAVLDARLPVSSEPRHHQYARRPPRD